jgi:hypothetical protein
MVCFCKSTLAQLQIVLPQLDVSASVAVGVDAQLQALANWLSLSGLPAQPWQPDEAWLDLELPTLSLSASAMATLSAFAQLRTGALALGIDLLIPGQATAFTRLAVSLSARLNAMLSASMSASASASMTVNASAWMQLAATLSAVAQVRAALELGLFPSPPPGVNLAPWQPFLASLVPLLPMIAISVQLGLSLSADLAANLSMMLRAMLQIKMPTMPSLSLSLMASLTAALSAVAQIKLSLGIDPLQVGLPHVQLMVSEQVALTVSAIETSLGLSLPNLLGLLPKLPYCPTLLAPPAVVSAAASLNLPPITWQVPAVADLPVLSIGLPVVALTAQMNAALGIGPARVPCPVCDAAALLSALL